MTEPRTKRPRTDNGNEMPPCLIPSCVSTAAKELGFQLSKYDPKFTVSANGHEIEMRFFSYGPALKSVMKGGESVMIVGSTSFRCCKQLSRVRHYDQYHAWPLVSDLMIDDDLVCLHPEGWKFTTCDHGPWVTPPFRCEPGTHRRIRYDVRCHHIDRRVRLTLAIGPHRTLEMHGTVVIDPLNSIGLPDPPWNDLTPERPLLGSNYFRVEKLCVMVHLRPPQAAPTSLRLLLGLPMGLLHLMAVQYLGRSKLPPKLQRATSFQGCMFRKLPSQMTRMMVLGFLPFDVLWATAGYATVPRRLLVTNLVNEIFRKIRTD